MHHRDASCDPDGDRLTNLAEYRNRTRPHEADSDQDGLTDGAEVRRFDTDPRSEDSDGDGALDGQDDGDRDGIPDEGEDGDHEGLVGTILQFDADRGILTFQTTLGDYPIAATVTADTRIEFGGACEGQEATTANLVEGQDVIELRFVQDDPNPEFPPIRSLLLDCPPVETP